jgi:adenosine deaminase
MIISCCNAQNKTDSLKYHIKTNNKNAFLGKTLEQDSVEILFLYDDLGEIRIQYYQIQKFLKTMQ